MGASSPSRILDPTKELAPMGRSCRLTRDRGRSCFATQSRLVAGNVMPLNLGLLPGRNTVAYCQLVTQSVTLFMLPSRAFPTKGNEWLASRIGPRK